MKLCIGGIVSPGTTLVNKTGGWRSFKPEHHYERCTKCGLCELLCPESCVTIGDEGYYEINYDYCKGCGICAHECPTTTIEMIIEVK